MGAEDSSSASSLVLDDTTVRSLLHDEGLPCDRINNDTWRSCFRGKASYFPFYVRVDQQGRFVTFAVVPYLRSPEPAAKAEVLYARLLELNQQVMMAKFSIDDDLDVVLTVEYPTDDIDASEFRDALDVLSFYADRHFAELAELAHERETD